ncbi:MAG: oligosaccharide flippase family protein, partial [Patescibacteria group bacterium]
MFKKLAKNTIWLSGSQIVGRAIGFVYFVFLARTLPVDTFGSFVWVIGFVYNFYPLADFGLERLVLKHISRAEGKANEYLAKLLPLRLFLALGALLLALGAGLVIGLEPDKLFKILLFGLAVLPYNLIYLLTSIEMAREKMAVYAKTTVCLSILSALLGCLGLSFGLGLNWLLLSYLTGNLIVLLALLVYLGRIDLDWGWKIDLPFYKTILSESWVFALLMIAAVFYLRISLVLVGRLMGDYWAGIYGSASKFVEAGILIPQGLALALFPASSRLLLESKTKLKALYLKGILIAFLLACPIGLGMYLGGPFVIPLVYGPNYQAAIPVFSLFGVLMVFFFVNSLAGNVIQNSNRIKQFIPLALA